MPELRNLYDTFTRETTAAVTAFEFSLPTAPSSPADCLALHPYGQEMSILRIHAAWASFCRELVLQSAYAEPTTMGGTKLSKAPQIAARNDALYKVKGQHRFGWEPRWHDAAKCINSANHLKVSNRGTIASALGVTPAPEPHLRCVRDYLAHRSEDTEQKLLALSQTLAPNQNLNAVELALAQVVSSRSNSSVTRLREWVEQLDAIAWAAIA
jgi:hypothetical protein